MSNSGPNALLQEFDNLNISAEKDVADAVEKEKATHQKSHDDASNMETFFFNALKRRDKEEADKKAAEDEKKKAEDEVLRRINEAVDARKTMRIAIGGVAKSAREEGAVAAIAHLTNMNAEGVAMGFVMDLCIFIFEMTLNVHYLKAATQYHMRQMREIAALGRLYAEDEEGNFPPIYGLDENGERTKLLTGDDITDPEIEANGYLLKPLRLTYDPSEKRDYDIYKLNGKGELTKEAYPRDWKIPDNNEGARILEAHGLSLRPNVFKSYEATILSYKEAIFGSESLSARDNFLVHGNIGEHGSQGKGKDYVTDGTIVAAQKALPPKAAMIKAR